MSLSRSEPTLRANSSAIAEDSPTSCMIQVVIVSSRTSRRTGNPASRACGTLRAVSAGVRATGGRRRRRDLVMIG
jgi:hypothetical protein